jgi:hypothetical protein
MRKTQAVLSLAVASTLVMPGIASASHSAGGGSPTQAFAVGSFKATHVVGITVHARFSAHLPPSGFSLLGPSNGHAVVDYEDSQGSARASGDFACGDVVNNTTFLVYHVDQATPTEFMTIFAEDHGSPSGDPGRDEALFAFGGRAGEFSCGGGATALQMTQGNVVIHDPFPNQ